MKSVPFTITFPTVSGTIATDCKISRAYDASLTPEMEHPDFMNFHAIWDTGAMWSSISMDVVNALGLKPFGRVRVNHAGGESVQNTYYVNVLLPNRIEVKTLKVTGGSMTDTDVLIGMDIMSLCDVAMTSANGTTKFSIQTPGSLDIDFEKI